MRQTQPVLPLYYAASFHEILRSKTIGRSILTSLRFLQLFDQGGEKSIALPVAAKFYIAAKSDIQEIAKFLLFPAWSIDIPLSNDQILRAVVKPI